MSSLLPYDVVGVLHEHLRKDRRPSDGLLHCSGDLIGSLRHAQLNAAGAPRIDSEIASDIRLRTGTQWHTYFNEVLARAGLTFMQEVKVTPWLPEGWSGTADWLFWDSAKRAFVLADLKTIKGEGLKWVQDAVKDEHLWQLSAYYHALVAGKFPMREGFSVLYLPMNDTADRAELIEPLVSDCAPLPREQVWQQMEERWAWTRVYLDSVPGSGLVNENLAPEIEREQKLAWQKKHSYWELRLTPHWTTSYCPFTTDLCGCSEQGTTKIGEYDVEGVYKARAGYEDHLPKIAPTPQQINRKRRELELV